jgi:glycosyltransferase involved in cell wall biosynthesis
MINVLSLVSYQVLPAKTGGQRSISLFNKYLAQQVNLFCVTTRNNQATGNEGYPVFNRLSNSPLRYANPFYFFTLRRIIKQHRITHLLIEHPYYGWLAVLLKWFTGVKLVVRSQNIEGLRWKTLGKSWWKLLWHYEKWVHRQADLSFFIQNNDLQYGIQHFGLQSTRCQLVTYGIEWSQPPAAVQKQQVQQYLRQQHNIPADHHILLFNGTFNYLPNQNALRLIIYNIAPLLERQKQFVYTILVCGKDIPPALTAAAPPGVILAGFVEDITTYFTGADIFINPVTEGGGIKTKLVEALGHNLNAVSTVNGAIGVDPALCAGKLTIVPDKDLQAFVDAIQTAAGYQADIPAAYFDHFYWKNITARAAEGLKKL